jgi:hypothetical protein
MISLLQVMMTVSSMRWMMGARCVSQCYTHVLVMLHARPRNAAQRPRNAIRISNGCDSTMFMMRSLSLSLMHSYTHMLAHIHPQPLACVPT